MSERWRSHRDASEALLRRDTAAHLVDRVFLEAPVRQWVLSLPIPLRYRLAYDHKLCSAVLGVFLCSVFGALQRRAGAELGVVGGRSGSVTFVQRFGGSINLHTHFHAIVLDGVYADPEDTGTPRFFALSPVSDEEVARVTATVAKRVVRLLIRRGLLDEAGPAASDPLAEEEPLLAACAQASVGHRSCRNSRVGGLRIDFVTRGVTGRRMSFSSQRSCLKSSVSSCPGPAAMRSDITRRLRAPRVSSADEALATVSAGVEVARGRDSGSFGSADSDPAAPSQGAGSFFHPRYLPWAKLIARVFESEVLVCPQCGGTAEVIAAIIQPPVIRAILNSLGLSPRAPPIAPARPASQVSAEF